MRANWPFSKGNRQLLLQGIPKPGGRSPNGRFQDLETKNAPSTLLPKTRAKSCFRILKPDFETGLQRQCAILLEPWCRSSAQFCFKALEQVGPPDVGPALPAFPAGAAKLPLAFCRIAYQNKNTRCAIRPDKRPDGNGQTDGHAPGFFITVIKTAGQRRLGQARHGCVTLVCWPEPLQDQDSDRSWPRAVPRPCRETRSPRPG